jgi:WD40 repeat protein
MSKDGRYVFFSVQDPKTGFDVYVIDLAGDGKLEPVLNSPFDEFDPRLSPDDKWLAYSSNENGTRELYVTPFPAGGSKWQVSSGGVAGHVSDRVAVDWSPDGKRLSYLQADKIYTVEVRTGGSKPEFSAPKERMSIPNGVEVISIIPEGNRSLATRPVGQRSASPMNLTVNWQHLLR